MNIYQKCVESADYIKQYADANGAVGIILGSGLGNLADEVEDAVIISYKDIPHFPMTNVIGHAGRLVIGKLNGIKVICMQGRFHFYEGYDMKIVSMPVRVMKLLGIRSLIVTNAAGGVNRDFNEGTLMVIDDFINFMGENPLTGPNVDEFGPRFPDMTLALDDSYKKLTFEAAKELNIDLRKGVYMSFRGPNYETPAEIRFAEVVGADAVGMSTVPEFLVARHANIPTLGISCITNMAAGITGKELSHLEVEAVARRVNNEFKSLIKLVITRM
ncbi:MAG: purine-nucleoside phosphorylase [Erysipelotrichaceae bacterium]|jgi:purine-nucleoside phosphorylase